jgi:hypothetical protein
MSDSLTAYHNREQDQARALEIFKIGIEMTKNSDTYPAIIEDKDEENVNHPKHYGGKDNIYEAIKVIEAWDLSFNLGNVIKYVSRAGKKDDLIQELEKAQFYLNREINNLKNQ